MSKSKIWRAKRRAFGGISNLIMFPVLVMIGAGMFSAGSNALAGVTINGNPFSTNQTETVCIPSSTTSCTFNSSTGQTTTTYHCSSIFNINCQLQCLLFGQNSQQCGLAEVTTANPPASPAYLILAFLNPNSSGGLGYIDDLIIAVGVVALVGFTVFGSGLSSASIYFGFIVLSYVGLWLLLTALAGNVFTQMPTIQTNDNVTVNTGVAFYSLLTLFYTIGVLQRMG